MEAKDTVMDTSEILKKKYLASRTNPTFEQLSGLGKLDAQDIAIAEAQAEISFKAGIREVVEFVERFCGKGLPYWNVKLKEWGIE